MIASKEHVCGKEVSNCGLLTMSKWIRAQRRNKCPICGGISGCEQKDSVAICLRQSAGSVKSVAIAGFGTGYIHHLSSNIYPAQYEKPPSFIAAPETRTCAYKELCSGWLEAHHLSYLTNIRGFLNPEKLGYTSISSQINDRDVEALQISKKARLTGVPGFWENDRGLHLAGPGGILLPVRRKDQSIVYCSINTEEAIRNRLNNKPSGKAPYIWLSSSRFGGAGVNPTCHVILRNPKKFIIIEGILKTDLSAQFWPDDASFIGLPGVTAGVEDAVNQVRDADQILIAFDADRKTNPGVRLALTSLILKLQARMEGLERVRLLSWAASSGKGLDDCLVAGKFESLETEKIGELA